MTRFSKPAARLRTLPPPLCECDGCAELSPHRSGAAVARNNRVADVCAADQAEGASSPTDWVPN